MITPVVYNGPDNSSSDMLDHYTNHCPSIKRDDSRAVIPWNINSLMPSPQSISSLQLLALMSLWLLYGPRAALAADECQYFGIQVVDSETGRGVALVELKTTNQVSYWTDSAGYIAINEPALWHQEVFFHVHSHGYQVPADFFGYRGVRLMVEPGQNTTVEIHRHNLAERLYRVTGADIYRDSLLLDQTVPMAQPLNNAHVTGADSVLSAVFQGKIYWFWGDTLVHHYPLGIFHATGAVSELPASHGIDEADRNASEGSHVDAASEHAVALEYFVDAKGIAKAVCPMPGDGPTWLEGLTVLPAADGTELVQAPADIPTVDTDQHAPPAADRPKSQRMFAGYAKIKPPLEVYERGIVEWNADKQEFELRLRFADDPSGYPMGHPVMSQHDGQLYVYYCRPLPLVRIPAGALFILQIFFKTPMSLLMGE
jgi:hypothetical protein